MLETCNGQAWVNLSCCLGRPYANHVIPARRTKSRNKEMKDNLRASTYVEKNVETKDVEIQTNDKNVVDEKAQDDDVKTIDGFIDCVASVRLDDFEQTDENGMKDVTAAIERSVSEDPPSQKCSAREFRHCYQRY